MIELYVIKRGKEEVWYTCIADKIKHVFAPYVVYRVTIEDVIDNEYDNMKWE